MIRRDLDRLLEVTVLLESRILKSVGSLQEYYTVVSSNLMEFLNPEQSYNYSEVEVDGGYLYKVEKFKKDPQFVVTLKKNGTSHVLDFYWPETEKGFERVEGLEGTNYLDTLVRIMQKEILPKLESGNISQIIFAPYQGDNIGELRAKVFNKILDKFVSLQKFTIFTKTDFIIIKKKND